MLYSRRRIDVVASLVITAMVLALLILPVYLLWHLTRAIQSGTAIAIVVVVLLVFTLIFSGALSLLTRAKRHEILASAAAYVVFWNFTLFDSEMLTYVDRYCAVLVVFIGNVGQFSAATNTWLAICGYMLHLWGSEKVVEISFQLRCWYEEIH